MNLYFSYISYLSKEIIIAFYFLKEGILKAANNYLQEMVIK